MVIDKVIKKNCLRTSTFINFEPKIANIKPTQLEKYTLYHNIRIKLEIKIKLPAEKSDKFDIFFSFQTVKVFELFVLHSIIMKFKFKI